MRPPRRTRHPASPLSQRSANGKRFVLLVSQFHPALSRSLLRGATEALRRAGASAGAIRVIGVPGAFELPVMAAHAARSRPRPHAIIALGVLIRGQTSQYEVLAHAVAEGLTHVSVTTGVPVTFGVVIAETMAQARARANGSGNRGEEAALAALGVLRIFEKEGMR